MEEDEKEEEEEEPEEKKKKSRDSESAVCRESPIVAVTVGGGVSQPCSSS